MLDQFKEQKQLWRESLKRSTAIRSVLQPFMNRRLARLDNQYSLSSDAQVMRAFKGMYDGERCFIVGNGPSLTPEDLNLVSGEYSFASNGIFKIFEETNWRPTYYVCVDRNFLALNIDTIATLDLPWKFIDLYISNRVSTIPSNTSFINQHLTYFDKHKFTTNNIGFSKELSRYICSGYTVTYAMIQIAMYMGFKEIYLLGIDHSYNRSIDSYGNIKSLHNRSNHFFFDDRDGGYYYYEGVEYAYSLTREIAASEGVAIFNATRGGNLNIFPRIDLETIITNGEFNSF